MSSNDERERRTELRISKIGMWVGILSLLATVCGVYIAFQTFNRASGRSNPNFKIRCDTSHLLVIAETAIEPKSIQIEVTNNGPDPLKAIRCDILTNISWAANKAEDQKITPERFEHEFNEILKPGESTRVEILPAVVAHMKTLNPPPGKETYWALCTVACSVQIVGDSYFTSGPKVRIGDGDVTSTSVSFGTTWKASDKVQSEPLNFGIAR